MKFISSPYNLEYTIYIFLYSFNFNAFSDFIKHYVIAIHPPAKQCCHHKIMQTEMQLCPESCKYDEKYLCRMEK